VETTILTWPTMVVVGATLCSAAIAYLLCRVRVPALAAALAGGLFPGSVIAAICLYLDGRAPEGGFFLLIGLPVILLAALFGSGASAITVLVFVGLRDGSSDPGLGE
jgi:hypothetical protein